MRTFKTLLMLGILGVLAACHATTNGGYNGYRPTSPTSIPSTSAYQRAEELREETTKRIDGFGKGECFARAQKRVDTDERGAGDVAEFGYRASTGSSVRCARKL